MLDTRELFEKHTLRCTRQRVELYETLAACKCHPTAEQLHRMVAERSPGTSLATVYNTLEAFTDAGLCRKINSSGGARYDADVSDHLHVVTTDGRLMDVPPEVGDEILRAIPRQALDRVQERLGIKVAHVEVLLRTS